MVLGAHVASWLWEAHLVPCRGGLLCQVQGLPCGQEGGVVLPPGAVAVGFPSALCCCPIPRLSGSPLGCLAVRSPCSRSLPVSMAVPSSSPSLTIFPLIPTRSHNFALKFLTMCTSQSASVTFFHSVGFSFTHLCLSPLARLSTEASGGDFSYLSSTCRILPGRRPGGLHRGWGLAMGPGEDSPGVAVPGPVCPSFPVCELQVSRPCIFRVRI